MAILSGLAVIAFVVGYLVLDARLAGVRFADPGLERAVRQALDADSGPLRTYELSQLTHLDAARYDVKDLSDLPNIPNLRTLDLSGNRIHSLVPLTDLRRLEELRLQDVHARDLEEMELASLASLRGLKRIDLSHNPSLARVAPLRALTGLREVSLRNTAVTDVGAIADLTGLQRLDLRDTDLSGADLGPLERLVVLERLNLRGTGIRDISFLTGRPALRYLNLHSNGEIESLEPLRALAQLETLILRNVPIADLEVIASMTQLSRLNVRNTGIRNLDVLAELMEDGALQDQPDAGVAADVDIRDNPIEGDAERGVFGYDVLLPYWERISHREPERLPRAPTRDVIINEVMTSNGGVVEASDGSHPDWIELHNPADADLDLGGYYLSASPDEPRSWRVPQHTMIPANGFLLVFAAGDGLVPAAGELNASFRLSSRGTGVFLTEPDGRTLVDRLDVPSVARNASFGRGKGARAGVAFVDPTPGEANVDGRELLELELSHDPGYYDEPFHLEISHPERSADREADIYYTLDGSVPDPEAVGEGTLRYTEPIRIFDTDALGRLRAETADRLSDIPTTIPEADRWEWNPPADPGFDATTVRAVAHDGTPRGPVRSATYLVDPRVSERFTTPVVSIIADPEDLFGHDKGIYVPGRVYEEHSGFDGYWMRHPANYTEARESPAHIEFFDVDGTTGFGLDSGLRIHGGWSRAHPLKSLRLYARKDYGRLNSFDYPIFPNAADTGESPANTRYRRLMLRSGQSLFRSHFQDAVLHEHLYGHVAVDLLRARPVVHFINGEYWGIKNLRERFDRFYLEQHYGVDPHSVIVLEGALGADAGLQAGKPGDADSFRSLKQYVDSNDMADGDHYRHVVSRMDVDSFIDYNIVRVYSGDPDGVSKHVSVWRVRDGEPDAQGPNDGRWRWHTWDLDNGLLFVDEDTMSFYANDRLPEELEEAQPTGHEGRSGDPPDPGAESTQVRMVRDPEYTSLIVGLLANDRFRQRFLNRFADLMNTVYRPGILEGAIRDAASLIEAEMPYHIERWGYPESMEFWRTQVGYHIVFARERPSIQRKHLREYFDQRGVSVGEAVEIRVQIPERGGSVRLNTIDLEEPTPGVVSGTAWAGVYFGNVPVRVEARAAPGYRFTGWGGDVPVSERDDEALSVVPADGTSLVPRFEPELSFSGERDVHDRLSGEAGTMYPD